MALGGAPRHPCPVRPSWWLSRGRRRARQHGRHGAAGAPQRHPPLALPDDILRLPGWSRFDGSPLVDLGNIKPPRTWNRHRMALGKVVSAILEAAASPSCSAAARDGYRSFPGLCGCEEEVGTLNIDAHLDVRLAARPGHSGSPFPRRWSIPRSRWPGTITLPGKHSHTASATHIGNTCSNGAVRCAGVVKLKHALAEHFSKEQERLAAAGCQVYVTHGR